jgi:hypothetical protein
MVNDGHVLSNAQFIKSFPIQVKKVPPESRMSTIAHPSAEKWTFMPLAGSAEAVFLLAYPRVPTYFIFRWAWIDHHRDSGPDHED